MKLFCNFCRRYTNHRVVQSHGQTYTPEDDPDMPVDYVEGTWEIIQCAGCDWGSFRELLFTSEDLEPTETCYPEADKDRLAVKTFRQAPDNINRIYKESIRSFNIGNFILCSVGLRAVIEGICEEAITTEEAKNLCKKIDELHKQGILAKKHAKILHALRSIGNKAVHELSTPPQDDLKAAIEIVEHTLENLYGLSAKGYWLLEKNKKTKR